MAQRIRDVMTTPPVVVGPDDEVTAVVELMRSTATTVLPVVHGDRLIGTVALDDLIAVLLDGTTADPYHRRVAAASAGTARGEDLG
ncbi:CBS domain-containing protein [Kribbella sp. NPDC048915]|uniref:CBS domain-containing protein n=1 Tax=Kribbella sp. NPDC048915 TaxID=3155148 RepID=UPI0033C89AAE